MYRLIKTSRWRPTDLQCKLFKRKSPRVVFQRAIVTRGSFRQTHPAIAPGKRLRFFEYFKRARERPTYLMYIYLSRVSPGFSAFRVSFWRNMPDKRQRVAPIASLKYIFRKNPHWRIFSDNLLFSLRHFELFSLPFDLLSYSHRQV